eukprot:TRINITY_DN8609_c0_g1_i1.p1 TRINITY_DN8609_c0_g1~~TRINITY_DN8609_c0_g1_i1.p1  ORF type:complete len:304 (-),score=39.70 TRINITY_DN8609_c0_g1_i1:29-940(-)
MEAVAPAAFDYEAKVRVTLARILAFLRSNSKEQQEVEVDKIQTTELAKYSLRQVRQALKEVLTALDRRLPSELNDACEEIVRCDCGKRAIVDAATDIKGLVPFGETSCRVGYWQGDISILKIGAIVNAANEYMLGCFTPNHACIDNVIHCWAGPKLRDECRDFMEAQNNELEKTGLAKITGGYCLPAAHVLHTVGPIVERSSLAGRGVPTPKQVAQLASCYTECLDLAAARGVRSVAFCCISTGVFGYPQDDAAVVALETVRGWLGAGDNASNMDLVLFNVYLDRDLQLYQEFFPRYFPEHKN